MRLHCTIKHPFYFILSLTITESFVFLLITKVIRKIAMIVIRLQWAKCSSLICSELYYFNCFIWTTFEESLISLPYIPFLEVLPSSNRRYFPNFKLFFPIYYLAILKAFILFQQLFIMLLLGLFLIMQIVNFGKSWNYKTEWSDLVVNFLYF